jgi:Lon protease-like protein
VDTLTIPLFPLGTVLFPGGPLPLRVFEPRYLAMVSRCLREGEEFGVVLILEGAEAGPGAVTTAGMGTLARIVDWYQGSDGILGVTARGGRCFRLHGMSRQEDGLNLGHVSLVPPVDPVPLPAEFDSMAQILKSVITDLGRLYEGVEPGYDDAEWVGCRLAEILPMAVADKQICLEMRDPLERLRFLRPMLRPLRTVKPQ